MKNHISKLEEEKESLEESNQALETEKNSLSEALKGIERNIIGEAEGSENEMSLEERASRINSKFTNLSTSLNQLRDTIIPTEETKAEENEQSSSESDSTTKSIIEVVNEMKSQITNLESENEKLKERSKLQEEEKNSLSEALKQVTEEKNYLEGSFKLQEEEKQSLEEVKKSLEENFKLQESEKKALNEEIASLKENNQSFKEVNQSLEAAKNSLSETLKQVERSIIGEAEGVEDDSEMSPEERATRITDKYANLSTSFNQLRDVIIPNNSEDASGASVKDISEQMKQQYDQLLSEKEKLQKSLEAIENNLFGSNKSSSVDELGDAIVNEVHHLSSEKEALDKALTKLRKDIVGNEEAGLDGQPVTSRSIAAPAESVPDSPLKTRDISNVVVSLREENSLQKQQLSELERERDELKKAFQSLKESVIGAANEDEGVEQTVDLIKARINKLEEEAKDLKSNLQQFNSIILDDQEESPQVLLQKVSSLKESESELSEALKLIESSLLCNDDDDDGDNKSVAERLSIINEKINQFKKQSSEVESLKAQLDEALKNDQGNQEIIENYNSIIENLLSNLGTIESDDDQLFNDNKKSNLTDKFKDQIERIRNYITTLKEENEKLKLNNYELSETVKSLIAKNKELSAKIDELSTKSSSCSSSSTENEMEKMLKKQKVLLKKYKSLEAELQSIRDYCVSLIPSMKSDSTKSSLNFIKLFATKIGYETGKFFTDKYASLFFKLDKRFASVSLEFDDAIQRCEELVYVKTVSSENYIKTAQTLRKMTDSYQKTLILLFPKTAKISPLSNPREIELKIERLINLVKSLFPFFPNAQIPNQSHLYGYVLALRKVFLSSASTSVSLDLSTDLSTDLSSSNFETRSRASSTMNSNLSKGLIYEYNKKIQKLKKQNDNSMSFDDIAQVLGDLLQVEPTEVDEQAIVDMFNAISDKFDESEKMKENIIQYKSLVDYFIEQLGDNVPNDCQEIVDKIKEVNFY
ncbi:hypothetical protein M9Y10_013127 [Tritrichomonas musculus]|uniref:Uncharacterized protein n=1 Tax=Tritrichomonas musculus TaxID=1915356 RepID=A0ABR2I788_9EUKA